MNGLTEEQKRAMAFQAAMGRNADSSSGFVETGVDAAAKKAAEMQAAPIPFAPAFPNGVVTERGGRFPIGTKVINGIPYGPFRPASATVSSFRAAPTPESLQPEGVQPIGNPKPTTGPATPGPVSLAPAPATPTASPEPVERPTPEGAQDKATATQANRKANAAFRSYMQMFAAQGR